MLTRPPPLQLQYDNTRPGVRPAPQPVPKPELKESGYFAQIAVFAAKVYQANWRYLVIGVAAINALRFLISALTAFHDVHITDIKTRHAPKLTQISLALGALYLVTAVLQFYGAISAALQRLTLIRVYVHLAFLSALLITVAGFITGVEYFLLAEDIISQCVELSVSGSWVSKSIFRGKLRHGQVPSPKVAQEQCLNAWSSGSISQVIAIFIFFLIPSIAFFLLAYTYYRQSTDPAHSANLLFKDARSDAIRLEAYPNVHYSPLYASDPSGPGGNERRGREVLRVRTPRRAGSGVKPQMQMQEAKKQKQNRSLMLLQMSPVMHTASASPYGISPGPPSYALPARVAHGYEQAWLGGVAEDGR
jgi:hypothetical protein